MLIEKEMNRGNFKLYIKKDRLKTPQREASVRASVWVAYSTAAREGEGVHIPI